LDKERGESYWNTLLDEQKESMSLFDLILLEDNVRITFEELFNFFFEERIIFREKLFIVVNTDDYTTPDDKLDIGENNVVGVIHEKNFLAIIDIIQQVCCIKSNDVLDDKNPVFKNEKARKLWERMLEAKKEEEKRKAKKMNINLTLPNIISTTAAKSTNLNIVSIWDVTLFQLYDTFNHLQNNDAHYINSVRVAVWGDEKKTFDPSLWYKNIFDKETD
jgi:hypothetical protein